MEFDDLFTVTNVDPEGKKFDRVSRIKAKSENYDMDLTLDINNEIYPLKEKEKIQLVLTANLDDDMDQGTFKVKPNSLMARFEYVCFGKIYKLEGLKDQKLALYISFGGLLMRLEGEAKYLNSSTVGLDVYLLIKKL